MEIQIKKENKKSVSGKNKDLIEFLESNDLDIKKYGSLFKRDKTTKKWNIDYMKLINLLLRQNEKSFNVNDYKNLFKFVKIERISTYIRATNPEQKEKLKKQYSLMKLLYNHNPLMDKSCLFVRQETRMLSKVKFDTLKNEFIRLFKQYELSSNDFYGNVNIRVLNEIYPKKDFLSNFVNTKTCQIAMDNTPIPKQQLKRDTMKIFKNRNNNKPYEQQRIRIFNNSRKRYNEIQKRLNTPKREQPIKKSKRVFEFKEPKFMNPNKLMKNKSIGYTMGNIDLNTLYFFGRC